MFALLVAAAIATQAPAPVDARERRTLIDMDLEVIEGDLHKPDGEIVRRAPRHQHQSLIQLRKEFSAKLLASAGQL